MQLLKRMKEGIEQTSLMPEYPDYMEIIEQGTKEQCIEWKDRQTGLMLKAKPDLIPVGTDYLVDLKTAQKADAESFAKEVINYGYHIQTVFYRAAVAACKPEASTVGPRLPAPCNSGYSKKPMPATGSRSASAMTIRSRILPRPASAKHSWASP